MSENSSNEDQSKLDGIPLSLDELIKIPIFTESLRPQLEKNMGAVVLRRFKKGEVICREGQEGSTAFYIIKGKVSAFINTPFSKVKTSSQTGSLFGIKNFVGKMKSFLSDANEKVPGIAAPRTISIDAPVDLAYDNPVAELGEGDLFGEMTCLSLYPRSATVVASVDCEMLEMLRNILNICQRNPEFKLKLDTSYRERALESHLKSIPLFASVDKDFLQYLKNRVELKSHQAGDIIFAEGDTADALYLVRRGFIKVSKKMPGGDMVLAYLPRGSYFGEMGLMGALVNETQPHSGGEGEAQLALPAEGALPAPANRTATCQAIDAAELVKIGIDDFKKMMTAYPSVAENIKKTIQSRTTMNNYVMTVPQDKSLGDFLDQGLFQAQNLLVLDLDKCTRCDACTKACAATHDGVSRLIREGLRFDNYLIATSCRQCNDPLCMAGCPVGSIRRKESLEIIIEDWCIGCGLCSKSCPYGNINMHPFDASEEDPKNPGVMKAVVKKKATTCDLCTDLKEPSCVYACPHDAAHRVSPREFFRLHGLESSILKE